MSTWRFGPWWFAMLLCCGAPLAQAEWTATARMGLLSTSGNSDADSFNARLDLRFDDDSWANRINLLALGAREENHTTAEAYEIGGRLAYSLDSSNFWFVRGQGRQDRFGGFRRQISQSAGYGRRLLDLDRQYLNLEIGAGARQALRQDGERVDEAIFRVGSEYRFELTEAVRFDFELATERGEENTATEFVAAMRTRVLSRVGLVLSYTLVNNSRVPADNTHTDAYTSISLEYSFP